MSKIGIQTHGVNQSIMRKGLRGGGIAKRGTGAALKGGGRAALRFGSGRTNLLEQLGRVEAERSNPNRRAEISRVHGELNRGYAKGGRIGLPSKRKDFKTHGKDVPTMAAEGGRIGLKKGGKPWGTGPKPGSHEFMMQNLHKRKGKAVGGVARGARKAADTFTEKAGGSEKGKPHSTKEGRIASGKRKIIRALQSYSKSGKRAAEPFVKESIWLDKLRKRKLGPRAGKGKSPGRPKFGEEAPSRPKKRWPPKYSDLLRRFPKVPQPHKAPGDTPYIPMPKHDPNKPKKYQPAATGGRIGFKKGGSDKNWIQKATASIKKRGTKGKCTPITKPGCTGRAKALAKTFKKMAAKRKS